MSSDSVLRPGTLVAGYEVDSLLGQGGMAVVYRATQRSLKRTVALKLLATELSGDAAFRERFEREGQLQAAIDHLHIVPVYEAGSSEHGLFLAMRLIAGPTLKQLISAGPLDPRRSLRLLAQVAQALDAAHQTGLIHRDVKAQNILVGENDHAYLADFGLIKAPDDDGLTGTGQFMGTIDYCAPEQIRGEPSGPAADCYALAGVLFECLTGDVPFPRANDPQTMQAVLTEPPPKPSERLAGLPTALDEVIARGLAKDPGQRPHPTAELIRAGTRALAGHDAAARPASPQATRITPSAGGQLTMPARVPGANRTPAAATVASGTIAEPARARGGPRGLAIVVVLAAVAIAGGFLVGRSGQTDAAAPAAQLSSATAGHLQLRYPAGWQLRATPSTVPGITFAGAVSLEHAGGELTAGEVPGGGGPDLLSEGLEAKLQGAAPKPDRVLLGDVAAYRYTGLKVAGSSSPLTLFAVPTADGVATVVCTPNDPAPAFEQRCGEIAATLRIVGTDALGFTPSPAYARRVTSTLERLETGIGTASARLRAAGTPGPQAAAARQVARAYAAAAARLRQTDASPLVRDAHQAAVTALTRLAAGYQRAAAAAAAQQAGAYTRARDSIRRADTALRGALKGLAKLGFRVAA